jgi:1-pyrroline-5-carboxylate dehydrogenase
MKRAADLIDERLFKLAAAMSLEVGKNRMEALGDIAETADLIRYACYQMEKNRGFIVKMGRDPLVGYHATNTSVMRPYGVWLVISPFNFPFALTGGPAGAALVTGNTIVIKPATDTPWIVRLLADCLRDADLPEGVFNFVTGPGSTLGQALIESPEVDGVTFTGSLAVGMKIFRDFAQGKWVRPTVLELGGKNPAIVSRKADLERAAIGIVRSAFEALVNRLVEMTSKLTIGDPTLRQNFLGPVINASSYRDYQQFCSELSQSGTLLTGGKVLTEGDFAKGYFCTPTLAVDLPMDHHLWKDEMFLPITTLTRVNNLDEAIKYANDVDYGLTAGFYGSKTEAKWFFQNIQAGVTYANRPQGATTGAWPGYQPFGGWKGSGSTGKNAGGHYYLPLYLREQIHTIID